MAHTPLQESVIAVVGASGVLGGLIATGLAERGATIIPTARSAEKLTVAGQDTAAFSLDLLDAEAGERLVEHARSEHGRLDGVVNAAGIVAFGPLVDTPDEVIEELNAVNATGPLTLLKRATPALADSQGFFANITGVIADTPMPGMAAYAASKGAVGTALQALTRELRRSKISVIDVRAPHTETGLVQRALVGEPPKLPEGLSPQACADRIVEAVANREKLVAADAF